MTSITEELSGAIDTLKATLSNSRALDLAIAVSDLGASTVVIEAKSVADARPSVRYTTPRPLTDADTVAAARVNRLATDIEFLADLYAIQEDIPGFLAVEATAQGTRYTLDFGGDLPTYIANARAMLAAQLSTAGTGQIMALISKVSGISESAPSASDALNGPVNF